MNILNKNNILTEKFRSIFLIISYFLKKRNWKKYQKELFNWHCQIFFDFTRVFSNDELEYIYKCIDLSANYRNISQYYSFFSYSHKIDYLNNIQNSTRLAYGLLVNSSQIINIALKIAKSKKMDLNLFEDKKYKFYGLGWDVKEKIDKIYFLFDNIFEVDKRFLDLIDRNLDNENIQKSGVISFSYSNGQLIEEKIYLYPKQNHDITSTILFSKHRKIHQYNTDLIITNPHLLSKFSAVAVDIINFYKKEMHIDLDTYSIDKKNKIETLYFDY